MSDKIRVERSVEIIAESITLKDLEELVQAARQNGLGDSTRVNVSSRTYNGSQWDPSDRSSTTYTVKIGL